mgnify:CR=1 FL=1
MSGPRAKSDPGGPLLVTPVGTVTVYTDELLSVVERLRALEQGLSDDLRRVLAADACRYGLPVPDRVPVALESARALCAEARQAFDDVVRLTTGAELFAERIQRDLGGYLAATVGADVLRALGAFAVLSPGLLALAALAGWTSIPDGEDGRLGTVRDFLLDHPELITSPEFVRFVSNLSTSIDDLTLGMSGWGWVSLLPTPPAADVAAGAAIVAAAGGSLGMLRETPVSVARISEASVAAAPTGVRDRLDRIPEGPQGRVLIERYEADGMPPRYVVYVAPTEDFTPFAVGEAWDSTSNVHGVAMGPAASVRAVELAMAEAGIRPGDEVALVGFSQGGLVATRVAASEHWNVVGLETHGAPTGHIDVPDGVAGLAIRHTDDLVPALAGPPQDHSLVQVERRAFREGMDIPDVQAAPAHQRSAYERTADAVDGAASAVVREQVAALDAFTAEYLELPGGRATALGYQATRISGGGSSS